MGTLFLTISRLLEVVPNFDDSAYLIVACIGIIIALIITLLPIILFFKVWRMCNDVKEMKDLLWDIKHNQDRN